MAHKCFISFKAEDEYYKKYIQENLSIDMIDKSLNEAIQSDDEEYILRKIREDYLSDSTITIFLIGLYSSENFGAWEQRFIKKELQASLYNGQNNSRSGILGVVLPEMTDSIFKGQKVCWGCQENINIVVINDSTTIKEFNYNYYIPNNKCHWGENDRYCALVKWDDFCDDPEKYIDKAFDKRAESIAQKVKVRP